MSPRLIRVVIIAASLALWFLSQAWLARRGFPEGAIGDGVHQLLGGVNAHLNAHPRQADVLLIISSGVIDAFALYLLGSALFGASLAPFWGLMGLFASRQLCQAACALPPPAGMVWRSPGFPSLLVTYGTSNDLFFSGHTAIAVYGACRLASLGKPWLTALAVCAAAFEAVTVLALRAHYTMDVFTGALAAILAAEAVRRWLAKDDNSHAPPK